MAARVSAALVALFLLLLRQSFVAKAILDPSDFLALQAVRKSLRDLPGSTFFASWEFTADPCGFSGVFCDGDRVVSLNLGDPRAGSPGLTGRLDTALGKLTAMAELTIVPGRVYGPIPPSLSNLPNLRFLAISRNFISGQIPAGIGRLRRLKTLDLSYNQLSGKIPRPIASLPDLTNLVLCHNRLSGEIPPFRSHALSRLDLSHNAISGELRQNSLPSSLTFLNLAWNRLSGPADRALQALENLNHLDLSLNQLSGEIPGRIFTFPITSLNLQRNQFSGQVRPSDQVAIPTVDLSFNRLSGEISPLLSTVQNLYLNNNRFMGQVPGSFVDRLLAAGIQVLYLQHNYLTGIQINPAAEIPVSSSLCLQYNCMVPPLQTPCPLRSGDQKTRPTSQCIEWKG